MKRITDEERKASREEEEKEYKAKRKEQVKQNKKHFHAIVELLGMDQTFELMQHLGIDEEIFDPDEGCPVISCRHCGACGGYESNIQWKKVLGDDGKQETMMEEETELFHWDITCNLCGEHWRAYLHSEL